MIKLTMYDSAGMKNGELFIFAAHIVAVQHANPTGALVHCVRGSYHVNQAVHQIMGLLPNPHQ
jgi:hypothetical protein